MKNVKQLMQFNLILITVLLFFNDTNIEQILCNSIEIFSNDMCFVVQKQRISQPLRHNSIKKAKDVWIGLWRNGKPDHNLRERGVAIGIVNR